MEADRMTTDEDNSLKQLLDMIDETNKKLDNILEYLKHNHDMMHAIITDLIGKTWKKMFEDVDKR